MPNFWEQFKKPAISGIKTIGEWFKGIPKRVGKVLDIKKITEPIKMMEPEPPVITKPEKRPLLERIFKPEPIEKAKEKMKEWLITAPREFVMPAVKGFLGKPIYEKVVEPVVPEKLKEPIGKVTPAAGAIAGWMTAYGTVSKAFGGLMAKTKIGESLIKNMPLVSRAIQTAGSYLTLDQIQAPLESTKEERAKIFEVGIPKYIGWGIAGAIAPGKPQYWLPTIFGSQYASSKLEGKPNEEAFSDALTSTAVFSLFKIAEKTLLKNPQQILKEQASKELGIKPTASVDEAHKSYLKLAQTYHPDKPTGDPEKFKAIRQAYDVFEKSPAQFQADIFTEIKDFYNYLRSPEGKGMALTVVRDMPMGFSIKEVQPLADRFAALTPEQRGIYEKELAKLKEEGVDYKIAQPQALDKAEAMIVEPKVPIKPPVAIEKVEPEIIPEVLPEIKPEVLPEVKPKIMAEVMKPEVKPDIGRRQEILKTIDEIHKKGFERVGSYTAIMGEDIEQNETLLKELDQLDKKLNFKTAKDAKTGKAITINDAVRMGDPTGIFYSDIPIRDFGELKTQKTLKFNNPTVFEDQWDAIEEWFGKKERKKLGQEYTDIKEKLQLDNPLITLGDLVKQPKVVEFWNSLDQRIIKEAIKKGHDGIIYYHNKEILSGEYVDLTEKEAIELVEIARPLEAEEVPPMKKVEEIVEEVKAGAPRPPGPPKEPPKTLTIPPSGDEYAFNINVEKLKTTPGGEKILRGIVESIRPEIEKAKGKSLTHEEVLEEANRIGTLTTLISRDMQKEQEAMMHNLKRNLTRLSNYIDKAKEEVPPEIWTEYIRALKAYSSNATARGRALEALKMEAKDVPVRDKYIREVIKRVEISAEEIVEAAKGVDFTDKRQADTFYRKFVKPSNRELFDDFRYTNMLSNPKTNIINALGGVFQIPVRVGVKLYSGAIDLVAHSLIGRERDHYISEVPAWTKGFINTIPEAFENMREAFSGSKAVMAPRVKGVDVFNIPTITKGIGWKLKFLVRAMESFDMFFHTAFRGAESEALAYKYDRMGKEIRPDEIREEADKIALRLIFRQKLGAKEQGYALSTLDRLTAQLYQAGRAIPPIRWAIPFIQTPTQVAKQGLELTPMGLADLPGSEDKITKLARTAFGSTVMLIAAMFAMQDRITWAVPSAKKEREYFYAAGKKPYSIKIGDSWVSYQRIGPLAYPFAMAAAVKHYSDEKGLEEGQMEVIGKMVLGMSKFFSDQTYMQGIGDLYKAIAGNEWERTYYTTRALTNLPKQLIPFSSFQGWLARALDDTYRDPATAWESIKVQIPFLSKTVKPYITPLGIESKREYPTFNAISPITISPEDPFYNKLYEAYVRDLKARRMVKERKEIAKKEKAETIEDLLLRAKFEEGAEPSAPGISPPGEWKGAKAPSKALVSPSKWRGR